MGSRSRYHLIMGALNIATEVARHNRQHRLRAWGYGLLAVLLWLASCGIIAVLIALPLALFGFHPPLWVVILATTAGVAVLIHNGVGYARHLFDIDVYRSSLYAFNPFGSDRARSEGLIMAGRTPSVSAAIVEGLSLAFLISQTLFCAPRFSVTAIRAARSQVHLDAAGQESAQRLVDLLLQHAGPWTPVSDHRDALNVMADLERMGLTESRVEDGLVQVRVIPEVRRAHVRAA